MRPTDFYRTDYNDLGWATMPVPGMWELHGYGDPLYVNWNYAWKGSFKNNPPFVPEEHNHVGSYRREFLIPAEWAGRQIVAHFGSVTSNLYLWVNGRFVGYSEDSKLSVEFDLTPYLKPGQKNLIAFQTFRWCDGSYLEDQDFFRLSGVARDCYLYARTKGAGLTDIRVTPDLDSDYRHGTLAVALTMRGGTKADLQLTYSIGPDGVMQVVQKMIADTAAKVADLYRFGMRMQLPYELEHSTYYGRGPVENYADRKSSAFVGLYSQTADEQAYPYIRPQETGTKSDVRWWKQTTLGGRGLMVMSDAPFSASALHYSIESLDDGEAKDQRHFPELSPVNYTELCVDKVQTGLGGATSWGSDAYALPQYRLPYKDYEFTFMLIPVKP